jgi:prepilin-type N-terminal cleavage/methylation domain-containing protein
MGRPNCHFLTKLRNRWPAPARDHAVVLCRAQSGYTVTEMLIVVAIIGLVSAIGIPFTSNTFAMFRLGGDARAIVNGVSVTKMRAAATFSQARLYVDLAARSSRIEVLQKGATPAWIAEAGTTVLSIHDNFGFSPAGTAPPNTQTTIAQAPACLTAAGAAIANTACIIFNSRGIPVDTTGAPTGINAIYLTDGITLYSITVSASGQLRLWRALAAGTPTWVQQ